MLIISLVQNSSKPQLVNHSLHKYHLLSITGNAKLVGTDPLPQIIKGENIPGNGGDREKEFVLESTGEGQVDINFEFKWKLDGTTLTYPITDIVSLTVVGG